MLTFMIAYIVGMFVGVYIVLDVMEKSQAELKQKYLELKKEHIRVLKNRKISNERTQLNLY